MIKMRDRIICIFIYVKKRRNEINVQKVMVHHLWKQLLWNSTSVDNWLCCLSSYYV